MSEGELDRKGCFITILAMLAVFLMFYVVIDMYADQRDMHHIRDLQQRVGQLESERR